MGQPLISGIRSKMKDMSCADLFGRLKAPRQAHGCPVHQERLRVAAGPQPPLVMPVLVTGIHVFRRRGWVRGCPRIKSVGFRPTERVHCRPVQIYDDLQMLRRTSFPSAGLDAAVHVLQWRALARKRRGCPRNKVRGLTAHGSSPGHGVLVLHCNRQINQYPKPDSSGAGPTMTIFGCIGDTPLSYFHSTKLNRTAVGQAGPRRIGARASFCTRIRW